MPDGIFVGYKDYGWGCRTAPEIAFYEVNDALAWKEKETDRDFKFIPLHKHE